MWHPSEDELILRLCGEAGEVDSRRVDEHLQTCQVCRAAWSEFSETLTLAGRASVPEPPDGFERVMWARVERAISAEAPRRAAWRYWLPVVSFAALVVLVAALGDLPWRSDANGPRTSATVADTRTTHERVLLTAMDDHLAQAELLLIEVMNAPEDDLNGPALAFERMTADDLIASGRLYRATAEQTGNHLVADMLDDLEPVLVEVARGPDKLASRDLSSLRTRIDNEALLFKVRAATQEIRERQQDITTNITNHEGN